MNSAAPRFWQRWSTWAFGCLLIMYSIALLFDIPQPANTKYAQNLSPAQILAWGGIPAKSAQVVQHWWDKAQALRGWSVYPEGWAWPRLENFALDRWLVLLLFGLIGAAGLWWIERRIARHSADIPWGALIGLVIFSFLFQVGTLWLKSSNAEQFLVDRITDKTFTGYLDSALEISDLDAFFSNYDQTLQSPTYCSHCRTHPPGPVLFFWLLLRASEQLPTTWQTNVAELFESVGDLHYHYFSASANIAATVGANLILLGAAAIVLPLYGLGRRLAGAHLAFPLAALGVALPGIILMSPEFDQFYATLSAGVLYLTLRGLDRPRYRSMWGFAAGLLFAFSLYWSFGLWILIVPVALVAIAFCTSPLSAFVRAGSEQAGRLPVPAAILWLACLMLGILLPWGMLWGLGGFHLPQVLLSIGRDHLYGITSVRPYVPWLVFNLVDFFQFLGLPLTLAALVALVGPSDQVLSPMPIRSASKSFLNRVQYSVARLFARVNIYGIIFWLLLLGLDLSGATRAEVGRLWLFLMPLALLAFYYAVGRGRFNREHIHGLLAAQFLICWLIGGTWLTP